MRPLASSGVAACLRLPSDASVSVISGLVSDAKLCECYFRCGVRSEGAWLLWGAVRLFADGNESDCVQSRRANRDSEQVARQSRLVEGTTRWQGLFTIRYLNYKGNRLQSLESTHVWKWPVVKYKHIKIKQEFVYYLFCVWLRWCMQIH